MKRRVRIDSCPAAVRCRPRSVSTLAIVEPRRVLQNARRRGNPRRLRSSRAGAAASLPVRGCRSRRLAHLRQALHEARKARVHRPLQRAVSAFFRRAAPVRRSKSRRAPGRPWRSPPSRRSRSRLIDAAEQESMPIGELAQPRRKRRVLRRRDDEKRVRDVFVAQRPGSVMRRTSAPASRSAAALSIASRSSAAPIDDAQSPVEIQTNRKERLSHVVALVIDRA